MAPVSGSGPVLVTERLILRRWREEDREAFAELNGDPVVMEYFPAPLGRAESDALVDRIEAGFERNRYGLWAVEAPGYAPFLGFVGLAEVTPSDPFAFAPAVEVGWRLGRAWWGRGFASEAAAAALDFALVDLEMDEVVSFTSTPNERSQRVMRRLGMLRDRDGDFDHPRVPEGHRLRRHVLYRMTRDRWTELKVL